MMTCTKNNITIHPNFFAFVHDRKGKLIQVSKGKNLVVNSGRQLIADLLLGDGFRPDTMQLGTGTSATTATMTALETTRITKTINRRIKLTYGCIVRALIAYDEGNGYTYSEGGSFFQSTMLARALISPTISKTASVQITIAHQFSFTATV